MIEKSYKGRKITTFPTGQRTPLNCIAMSRDELVAPPHVFTHATYLRS